MEDIFESKNFLKYDMPVGRKQFFKNIAIIFAFSFPATLMLILLRLFLGGRTLVTVFLIILSLLIYLPLIYCTIINYAKRLYDIICDKQKALLYAILYYVGVLAMSFIPKLALLSFLLSITVFCFCSFVKGKMLTFEKSDIEANDE